MFILVDTHYLIWALDQPASLPQAAKTALEDPDNVIFYSAINIWEIAIKTALGRAHFHGRPDRVAEVARMTGFRSLPVTDADAARVATLPLHHRDPFDRLLIAQALGHPARFLTADAILARYSELVWVSPV